MRTRLNQAEVTALPTVEDVYSHAPRIQKNKKLPMRHFQLQDRFIHKHRLDRKTFGPDDSMFVMLVLFGRLGMQDLFVEVLHDVFSRPMFSHETRLTFPHLPRDLVRGRVDGSVHVICLFTGLYRDMIGANEHDLRGVPVFLDRQDDVCLDDPGVIEVKALNLFGYVLVDRIGNREVTAGNFDGRMGVGRDHLFSFAYI